MLGQSNTHDYQDNQEQIKEAFEIISYFNRLARTEIKNELLRSLTGVGAFIAASHFLKTNPASLWVASAAMTAILGYNLHKTNNVCQHIKNCYNRAAEKLGNSEAVSYLAPFKNIVAPIKELEPSDLITSFKGRPLMIAFTGVIFVCAPTLLPAAFIQTTNSTKAASIYETLKASIQVKDALTKKYPHLAPKQP